VVEQLTDRARLGVGQQQRVRGVGDLDLSLELRVVVEKDDLLRAQRELGPELSEAARIVGVDDDPKVAGVPELDLARPEQDLICPLGSRNR
jgi:hypothetical protein